LQDALAELIACNRLEEIDVNLYSGHSSRRNGSRIYGGQVLAQALSAAQRTVSDEYTLHSLHSYFMRMGDPKEAVVYEVDPIRDGRSFVTRRVVARQYGKAIFSAELSFQRPETGLEHTRPMPDVPGPEGLASDEDLYRQHFGGGDYHWPIEFRQVAPQDLKNPQPSDPVSYAWFKTTDRISDDLASHQQLLAYASDNPILVTALRPHAVSHMRPDVMVITLDHALWFYQPFRVDDWLLYEVHSDVAGHGRALSRGRIYNRQGQLVAVVNQEGLLRIRK
jgi:acyl-CoA thioesterase-2